MNKNSRIWSLVVVSVNCILIAISVYKNLAGLRLFLYSFCLERSAFIENAAIFLPFHPFPLEMIGIFVVRWGGSFLLSAVFCNLVLVVSRQIDWRAYIKLYFVLIIIWALSAFPLIFCVEYMIHFFAQEEARISYWEIISDYALPECYIPCCALIGFLGMKRLW